MTTMQEKVSKEVLEGSWIEDKKSLTKFGDRSPSTFSWNWTWLDCLVLNLAGFLRIGCYASI